MDITPTKWMHGLLGNDSHFDSFGHVKWVRLNMMESTVNITVRGFIAHLSIDLEYLNASGRTLEVTYTCPIDAKSAIFDFQAELNNRKIRTQCVEREKAEAIYKAAVTHGLSAAIATESLQTSDVLQLSLGNLGKDEIAKLHVEMVMELPVGTDGSVQFTLPIVFNRRYSSSFDCGPPQSITATAFSHQAKLYETVVKTKVVGTQKIDRIVSSSSTFDVDLIEGDTSAELKNFSIGSIEKDWGFKVYYHSSHQPHILKETGDRSTTGMMADDILMINLFPELSEDSFSPHNEIIFVVDCSGSMRGPRIATSKSTLNLFLKSLPQGSRFNIICFGSDYRPMFQSRSERYTESTLSSAFTFHKSIDSNMGGTEIYNTLKYIYSSEPTPGYARQVLVLTDGEVWDVERVLDLVARNSGDTRMFSVGIGDGASTALVQGLARAGNGRHEMVNDVSQLQIKVMGLLANMLQNSVTDVKVNIQLDPPQDVSLIPKVPPVIFSGQHLILYARVPPKSTVKHVYIIGKTGTKTMLHEITEENCKQIHDTKFSIHRIAAKRQLTEWQLIDDEEIQKIVKLSITSGVVCRQTALVGIDQEGHQLQSQYARAYSLTEHSLIFPNQQCGRTSGLFGPSVLGSSNRTPVVGSNNQSPTFGSSNQTPACGFRNQTFAFGFSNQVCSFGSNNQARVFGSSIQAPVVDSSNQTPVVVSYNQARAFCSSNQTSSFGSSNQTPVVGFNNQAPSFGSSNQTPAFSSSSGQTAFLPPNMSMPNQAQGFSFGQNEKTSSLCGASSFLFGSNQSQNTTSSVQMFQSNEQSLVNHFIEDCSFEEDECDDAGFGLGFDEYDSEPSIKMFREPQKDLLVDLIMEQNFDGSWNPDVVTKLLKLSEEQIKKMQIIKLEHKLDDISFATVVCLAWLSASHMQRKPEWNMIGIKGNMFLMSKELNLSDVIEKCVKLFST